MASRQNRKKKGRGNQQNRERTVTTLLEDPNTQFLVPTPSEEPARGNMSSPFSGASSSGGNNPNVSYNFAYSGPPSTFNNNGYISGLQNVQQQQQSSHTQQIYLQQQQVRTDLEILESLKAQIKAGTHDLFKPNPQPRKLVEAYEGPLQLDLSYDYQTASFNQNSYDVDLAAGDAGTKTALSTGASHGLPRIQNKDADDPSAARGSVQSSPASGPQAITNSNQPPQTGIRYGTNKANDVNSTPAKLGNDTGSTAGSKASADSSMGSDNAQPAHSRYGRKEQRAQDANNQANGQRRPPGDSPITGEYGSRARALSDTSPLQPLYDGKGDARAGRDSAWQPRDGPAAQDDKRGRPEPDRPGSNGTPDSRSNLNDADNRGPVPRDRGFYDLDRDRERDRDRDRERGWDRERDRDRRPDYRRDERPRMTDARRPPPDQRHYEPRYSSDMPRRNDNRPPSDDAMDVDKRPPPPIPRPGPIDDRAGRPAPVDHPVRPPVDDRVPPRAQPPDRSARVPPVDDRQSRPPPADNRRAPSPEDRSLRPAPSQDVPPRLGPGVRPPAASDDHGMARLSLGERIHPPPPLQDRITHPPPVARVDDRLTRQPSLEERISHAPDRPIPHDDRAVRPSTADRTARPAEPIRPQEERIGRPDDRTVRPGPPGDRYVGPVTPRGGAGYPPVPRSSSVVRDDPRGLRTPPSPPPGRDYRPARPPSREMRRLEVDRPPYDLDRRPDIMDIDPASARFNESRPPAYPRRLTPPPADRARAYPPPPLPPRAEPGYVELDRRFPPGDRRDYPYEGRPRQLSGTEEDSWKSQPRPESWDREALDKDRLLRGVPPARHNGWETREERERRGSFPGSPARPLEASQQRPLGSRLSDNYSGPGEDRSYPPRDLERSRYPPPLDGPATYSRVRPRSPSPISRRPGPGSVIDDGRPPMKRPREDAPYPPGYYSPEPRRPIAGGPSDYPTRSGQTPRPDGGAAYYDARLPPVRSGPPPYDRDYPVARDRGSEVGGYVSGPSSYDRPPRSPPPRPPPQIYPSRGNYTRGGGDPRDDRAYGSNMPPPPRSG